MTNWLRLLKRSAEDIVDDIFSEDEDEDVQDLFRAMDALVKQEALIAARRAVNSSKNQNISKSSGK